jgi:tRNA pseudouridine55 synthase
MEWPIEMVDISGMKNHTKEIVSQYILSQKTQIPPKYSAIHIEGKRAYELSRKWKEFEIPARPIDISDLEILSYEPPRITIRLSISSGGYIRSFAPLLTEFFALPGSGCITMLHREKIGNIDLTRSMGFDSLDLSNTILYSDLFPHIPTYELDTIYQKPLIDGLIVTVGTEIERVNKSEILVVCGDMRSLALWTADGIKVIKNFV